MFTSYNSSPFIYFFTTEITVIAKKMIVTAKLIIKYGRLFITVVVILKNIYVIIAENTSKINKMLNLSEILFIFLFHPCVSTVTCVFVILYPLTLQALLCQFGFERL